MRNLNIRWLATIAFVSILVAIVGISAISLIRGEHGKAVLDLASPPTNSTRPPTTGVADIEHDGTSTFPTPRKPTARIILPSEAVIQWETLRFSLEGFQPAETVTLQVKDGDSFKDIGQVQVDGEGKADNAEILLPSWLESGTKDVQAVGDSGQTVAMGTMHIRAKELWANLSTYSLQQASKLGFIAGGFQPGDLIKVYLTDSGNPEEVGSQQPLATMESDESGNTTWKEVEIPVVRPGKYVLLMKGDKGDVLATNVEVMPLTPELELSPWAGLPGREVDINAKGFLPNEKVDLFIGQVGEPAATFTADQYGGIWGGGPIAVPIEFQGEKLSFILRGQSSGAIVIRDFSVIAPHPWLDLSSYSGYGGATVVASGGGFAAGEMVTLHLGSASGPTLAEANTDEQGRYLGLGPAQVPSDAKESVVFVVVGQRSGVQASATFKVQQPFHPEIPEQGR